MTEFEQADVTVGNASVTAFSGSGASYSATVTPSATRTVTVSVAAGVARDAGGNPNTASGKFTVQVKLNAPRWCGSTSAMAAGGCSSLPVAIDVIEVAEPPLPPDAPEVTSSSVSSLTLTWTALESAGRPALAAYEVQLSARGRRTVLALRRKLLVEGRASPFPSLWKSGKVPSDTWMWKPLWLPAEANRQLLKIHGLLSFPPIHKGRAMMGVITLLAGLWISCGADSPQEPPGCVPESHPGTLVGEWEHPSGARFSFHQDRDYSHTYKGSTIEEGTWEADSTRVWITFPGIKHESTEDDGYHLNEDGTYIRLSSAFDFYETGRWERHKDTTILYRIWELHYLINTCAQPHELQIASWIAVPWGSTFTRTDSSS